jgi:hypothetical protein
MKRIITLIFAFTFVFSCNSIAQQMHNKSMLPEINKAHSHAPAQLRKIIKNNLKSDKSLKWNWDTIVFYDTSDVQAKRYTRIYTPEGYLSIYKVDKWESNSWINDWRFTYTYDTKGRELITTQDYWKNSEFIIAYRDTYTYDENGNCTSDATERINEDNTLHNFYRILRTYTTDGKELTFEEDVEGVNNTWFCRNRHTHTYDLNGNETSYFGETNSYEPPNYLMEKSKRITYTYNSNNKLLTKICEEFFHDELNNLQTDSYTYDAEGRILTYFIDGLSSFLQNKWNNKEIYTYDNKGNILTHIYENWSQDTLFQRRNYIFTYDINNNILTAQFDGFYDNIYSSYLSTYTYDSHNNKLTNIDKVWENNQWVNDRRFTYQYNENDILIMDLDEYWWDNIWRKSIKHTYAYDANRNKLLEMVEDWDDNVLAEGSKLTYIYDLNNKLLSRYHEEFSNNKWDTISRRTYSYDINGKELTFLSELWENKIWVNYYLYTHTYDTDGNLLLYTRQYWRNNTWDEVAKYIYTYDENGNSYTGKNVYFWPESCEDDETEQILSLFSNKIEVSGFCEYSYKAHWAQIQEGVDELTRSNSQLTIYPNPASSLIVVSCPLIEKENVNISIYDLIGKLVYTENASTKNIKINTSNLNDGIYVLKLTGKDINATKKLVVSHK